jgi:hypothetical protein
MSTGGQSDRKKDYMNWLEWMWEVQKLDVPSRTEREEASVEEILKFCKGLGELAKRHVDPSPTASHWESGQERSLASVARHEQKDRSELEVAGWELLKRSDGEDVWLDPDNGFMYQQAVALAIVRDGNRL